MANYSFCSLKGLIWILLFGLAFTQSPLYFSNQHQYFVHGLAQGGLGDLGRDWLANTLDPTPLFSKLVELTYRYIGEFGFYLLFFGLVSVYFVGLSRLGSDLLPADYHRTNFVLLLVCLLMIHAALVRVASVHLFGVDYPWYFQAGIAGQYILGSYLQPSAFGAFFLLSLLSFRRENWISTCLWCCLPAIVHATYLLPAAFLTLGYQYSLLVQKRWRTALFLGLGNLFLVLPIVIFSWQTFSPTSLADFEEAQRILAEVRIPHHARIARWFDALVALQIAWMLLGLLALRKTVFFPIYLVIVLLSFLLSLTQYFTSNYSLALLFPWRVTALLVPIATVAILARVVRFIGGETRIAQFEGVEKLGLLVALLLASGSFLIPYLHWGYRQNELEKSVLEYIREHHSPGDVYLIPVQIPKPDNGVKGNTSTTFTRPPSVQDKHLVAVDLQPFRIATGTPLYVDFKSIPYKDTEVIEWYRRVLNAHQWYQRKDMGSAAWQAEVRHEGITHVLIPLNKESNFGGLKPIYEDEMYRIYALR